MFISGRIRTSKDAAFQQRTRPSSLSSNLSLLSPASLAHRVRSFGTDVVLLVIAVTSCTSPRAYSFPSDGRRHPGVEVHRIQQRTRPLSRPEVTENAIPAYDHEPRTRPDACIKLFGFLATSPDPSTASQPCSYPGVGRPAKPSCPSRRRRLSRGPTWSRRIGSYGNTPGLPRGRNGQHHHSLG